EATLIVSGGFRRSENVIASINAKELESNHVVDASRDVEGARELVGCGRSLLDQRVVVADPESLVECPPGQVGEILVKGSSVAQGYWNRSDETHRTFRAYLSRTGEGPFLRTGDLGFLSNEELFVTGRRKDLI